MNAKEMFEEMKIEVGMYVRTRLGMGKIIEISDEDVKIDVAKDYTMTLPISKTNLKKSSCKIIDLIEVGDYVNGDKITLINKQKSILYAEDSEGYLITTFYNDDIKSIVTKEQFKNMEYRIGE